MDSPHRWLVVVAYAIWIATVGAMVVAAVRLSRRRRPDGEDAETAGVVPSRWILILAAALVGVYTVLRLIFHLSVPALLITAATGFALGILQRVLERSRATAQERRVSRES